jgi:hypothetical protein
MIIAVVNCHAVTFAKGMEFLPNFPLHFYLPAMVCRVFSSMKKSIHKVMAENNLDRNKEKPDHLHIVVTRVFDLEKPGWVVSDWDSYEDLVETCKASCSFPWQQVSVCICIH